MPSIEIKEESRIGTGRVDADSKVVAVPVKITNASAENAAGSVLVKSVKELTEAKAGKLKSLLADDEIYITKLILAGLPVLVIPFKATPDLTFLSDKSLYNIRFITEGTVSEGTITSLVKGVADSRGDCIALINKKTNEQANTFGKNVAAFGPEIKFADNSEKAFPAVLGYLLAFAESTRSYPVWYAAAGSVRGQIPGISAISPEIGEVESEKWLANKINPVANISPFGKIIWGNRTASAEDDSSPYSYLNIRNLLCTLHKTLRVACRKLTFEQNNDILWVNFRNSISPILDEMKSGNGIFDYKILKKRTNKKATLGAVIVISPIEAVENFEINVVLTDEGGVEISTPDKE